MVFAVTAETSIIPQRYQTTFLQVAVTPLKFRLSICTYVCTNKDFVQKKVGTSFFARKQNIYLNDLGKQEKGAAKRSERGL